MTKALIGLTSVEGDRLGHLVRGIQMLGSYGHEASALRCSDVINLESGGNEPAALYCLIECDSAATREAMAGILRETNWALGDEPKTLTCRIIRFDASDESPIPGPFDAIWAGKLRHGMTVFMGARDFGRLCGWGQVLLNGETKIIGEWPSATGR